VTIKKIDLIDAVEKQIGPRFTKKDIALIVNLFLKEISRQLAEGNRIEIRRFGIFKTNKRKEKIAKNPKTGKEIHIPARLVPVFKPSKILKQMVSQR